MTLSRRELLAAAGAGAILAALPVTRASADGALPDLSTLPPGAPDRRLFAPEEQRYAPYLMIPAPMVNDIADTDPETYGFFAGGWWRSPAAPYNARV